MRGAPALLTMKQPCMASVSTSPELVLLCPTGACNPHSKHSLVRCPSNTSAQSIPPSWHSTEPVRAFP